MSANSLSTGGHLLDKFKQQFLMKTLLALTRTANEAPQHQEHNELAQVAPMACKPWLVSLYAYWHRRLSVFSSLLVLTIISDVTANLEVKQLKLVSFYLHSWHNSLILQAMCML